MNLVIVIFPLQLLIFLKKFKMKPILLISLFILINILGIGIASAVTAEIPFGGMHTVTLGSETCDCGGNSHFITDYMTNSEIMLFRSPKSIFYNYFNASGLYQLGTYSSPATSDCRMYVYYTCITIVTNTGDYGMLPGTGTTLE